MHACVCIYIYIINKTHHSPPLSLSPYIYIYILIDSPLIFPFSSVLATIYNCMTGANWISRRRLFISAMMKEEVGWKMLTGPGTTKWVGKTEHLVIGAYFHNNGNYTYWMSTHLWWQEAYMDCFHSVPQHHWRQY